MGFTFSAFSPLWQYNTYFVLPKDNSAVNGNNGKISEIPVPSPADYHAVSDENLFHPERKIPAEKKQEPELPKPEFVLYGTMVGDELNIAYLEDLKAKRSTPGRGVRQTALKQGDSLSGFILKEIQSEKIVMVRGEEVMTVYVRDPQRKKPRQQSTATNQATVKQPQTPRTPDIRQAQPTSSPSANVQKAPVVSSQPYLPPQSNEEAKIINFFESRKGIVQQLMPK